MKAKPNQIARALAFLALIGALVLVVSVVVDSGGDSGGDGKKSGGETTTAQISPEFRRAIAKGVYIVKPGDTLTRIAEGAQIDIDDLIALNPDTDPQALIAGRPIRLR